ncbi:MAG: winged helix DNA-binding protein [Thiolinea sp.]
MAGYGELDQVTLGGVTALDRTTTAHVISKLLDRGLVSRRASCRDKRFKRVAITAAGRTLLATVQPVVETVQTELLSPLTTAEAATLVSLLQKIAVEKNHWSRAPHKGG